MTKRIVAFCLFLSLPAVAQVEMQSSFSYAPPHFYFNALNFKTDEGKSRLDFYFQIPYGEIQFIKQGNEFVGSYEISLQLTDKDGNPSLEKTWDIRLSCESFDETTSRSIFSSTERQFLVLPGTYSLQVAVTDSETKKSYSEKRTFVARDYTAPSISMSDIMLLKNFSFSEGRNTITPNIDGNVISRLDSFPIFYEVYFPTTDDSTFASTEIFDSNKKIVYSESKYIRGTDKTKRIIAQIPKDSIPMGVYNLSVNLHGTAEKDAPVIANASQFFTIHLPNLPLTILNLDQAAEEMLYVANSNTIDSIKSAPDMFAKEKLFLSFWRRYNPNSDSKTNLIMDEYYNRVAYANEHFTHYFKGWRTDMGMIYILFGPPNSVDRHPFEVDSKPYEVWDYYQNNREFVFVDETGFGDYHLVTPLSDVFSPPYGPGYIGK